MVEEQIWYTVKEACEYLRISKPTLYRYCKDGLLAYYSLPGGGRRFKKEDLDALLEPGKADASKKEAAE